MENDSFEFKRKDSKIDYKKEFNMVILYLFIEL